MWPRNKKIWATRIHESFLHAHTPISPQVSCGRACDGRGGVSCFLCLAAETRKHESYNLQSVGRPSKTRPFAATTDRLTAVGESRSLLYEIVFSWPQPRDNF